VTAENRFDLYLYLSQSQIAVPAVTALCACFGTISVSDHERKPLKDCS
jgi:hypothetical protein